MVRVLRSMVELVRSPTNACWPCCYLVLLINTPMRNFRLPNFFFFFLKGGGKGGMWAFTVDRVLYGIFNQKDFLLYQTRSNR